VLVAHLLASVQECCMDGVPSPPVRPRHPFPFLARIPSPSASFARLWRTDVRHDGRVLWHELHGRRCGGAAYNGRQAPRTKAFPKQACRTDTAWCISPTEIGTKGSSDAAKCTDLGSTIGRKAPCTVVNGSEAS